MLAVCPAEIRATRERLGLTQVEAGEWPCWARPPPSSPPADGQPFQYWLTPGKQTTKVPPCRKIL